MMSRSKLVLEVLITSCDVGVDSFSVMLDLDLVLFIFLFLLPFVLVLSRV